MRRFFFILIAVACINTSAALAQNLLINEFQASNGFTVTDNYGEYDDWIEIANTGSQDINLNGYFITDDLNLKSKFPLVATSNELRPPGRIPDPLGR